MFTNQPFEKSNFLTRVRTFLIFIFSFIITCQATTAQAQKPNIILILADDVGYKSLTCNGGNLYSTPHIDTLAQQGMRFTQCHSTPSCSPSRQMLLTGKYNFRNYVEWGTMDINQKTMGNMMKDVGYKTAFFGKDQLNGGAESINSWGFNDYCVHFPFDGKTAGSKYKNPHLYTHGAFLTDSLTLNKYGPDITSDSVLSFIENNKTVPFFIYYPMILCHGPFQPTPDDADFAKKKQANDTSYYPSMVKYMDKLVGKMVTKIRETGIENNTVIIFIGDNGTSDHISEYAGADSLFKGGKWSTKENGTHVPMIVYWPETIQAGSINDDLIDFTDFLPTLADLAKISVPTNYGELDGVSFSSRLAGQPGTPRDWIFNDYAERPGVDTLKRWAQTKTYKLYDTSSANSKRLFYNISNDVNEKNPIPDASLSAQEVVIKQQLLDVINGYVAQGTPIISLNPVLSLITNSSVVLKDTIKINGGSTITACGAVWSTSPNPEISSSNHTSAGVMWGPFSTSLLALTSNTTYYVRAYATNFAGTAYSNQIVFKTLGSPVATAATDIDSNKFMANWDIYTSGANYRLDVSPSPTFSQINTTKITEGFTNGLTPPAGWAISNNIVTNTSAFGAASPSLEFTASNARIVTSQLSGPATELTFWIRGLNTNQTSALLVEGFDGNNWTVVTNITGLSKNGAKKTFNISSDPPLAQSFIQFRFTYTQKSGTLAFDDVSIKYNKQVPLFVSGYDNLNIKTNSIIVTGLKAATSYYYRVRAVAGGTTTGNSNVIAATTCKIASISNITKGNLSCNGSQDGSVALTVTGGVEPLTYSWTGPNGFISANKDISNLEAGTYHLKVTSNGGCAADSDIIITEPPALIPSETHTQINCNGGGSTVSITASGGTAPYSGTGDFSQSAGTHTYTVTDANGCTASIDVSLTDPPALNASLNADPITCIGGTTTLIVSAQGGTGSYHYTLSDGTGPKDDDHFTITAGSYTVTITDDNGCSFTTDTVQVDDGTDPCGGIALKDNDKKQSDKIKAATKSSELNVRLFPNPSSAEFTLTVQNNGNERLEIMVMDMHGKKVYHANGGSNDKYIFGKTFASGEYFVHVSSGKLSKTIKIIKGN